MKSKTFSGSWVALTLAALFNVSNAPVARAADPSIDYLEPASLTGTIYTADSNTNKVLFTFRRAATRSGSTVRVLREYLEPNGTVAVTERVVYEKDQLVSFELEDRLSGAHGSAKVQMGSARPRSGKILFDYARDKDSPGKTDSEKLQADVLVNDMIGPFIQAHWTGLMGGDTVKFRFIALSRAETVGLQVIKESEKTRNGITTVTLRMEPSSMIIAQFVDPLYFIAEKEGAHRILQYSGRTTPLIKKNGKWVPLDARTVFDWK